MMSLYIIVRIGLFPVFFMLGNRLSKKHSFTLTYTIGLILITTALIYALMAGALFERNPYYVLIAAAIVGSGEGFYYFSANTCNQIVSTMQTRASFLSYNGAFNTIAGLFAPVFVSFLISIYEKEMDAYKAMLMAIIIIFIIVIFIALKINSKSADKESNIISVLRISNDRQWNDHNLAVFIYGLRDGLGLNTISLLVYNAAGNGNTYSKLQVLFCLLSIISYYSTKFLLNKRNIGLTFKTGVFFKIISTLVLVYIPNTRGAIIYGTINAFAAAFYDNSYNYLSASIIGRYENEMTARVVARETYLSFGRCVSMSVVLLCYRFLPENLYLTVAVSLLSFAPIFVEKLLIRYK